MKKLVCVLLTLLMLLACVSCADNTQGEAKNYMFQSGNVQIKIDAEAEAILAALGDWLDYSESPSCAFDGLDKIYVYAGFRVQTYPQNGKEYIRSVELVDDSVATDKGITIGSTKEQVTSVYGDPDDMTDTTAVYRDDANGMYLQFIFRDGKVTNIQYLKDVE